MNLEGNSKTAIKIQFFNIFKIEFKGHFYKKLIVSKWNLQRYEAFLIDFLY